MLSKILLLLILPLIEAAILNRSRENRVETMDNSAGCPPLPTFKQNTPSTKAAIISFNPPMTENAMETNFTCLPVPGTNMTIVTAFAALFGGDPHQLISPANFQWNLNLRCHPTLKYWYMEELVTDIMWHIRFYKIRCNSFLLTDAEDIDQIGKELENTPFP